MFSKQYKFYGFWVWNNFLPCSVELGQYFRQNVFSYWPVGDNRPRSGSESRSILYSAFAKSEKTAATKHTRTIATVESRRESIDETIRLPLKSGPRAILVLAKCQGNPFRKRSSRGFFFLLLFPNGNRIERK